MRSGEPNWCDQETHHLVSSRLVIGRFTEEEGTDLGLTGKSAIVTGGSTEIGGAIALALAHNVGDIGRHCFVQVMRRD